MLEKKVFIGSNDKFSLICPKCERTETVSVFQHKDIDKPVRIKYRCPCGHVYHILVERRKYYRKGTNLPGTYLFGKNVRGSMIVRDLSLIGLKLELRDKQHFAVGDRLVVEFFLDDSHHSLIRKEIIIKKISGITIGAEFYTAELEKSDDKAIQFYLIP